jgi:hypothetical protein
MVDGAGAGLGLFVGVSFQIEQCLTHHLRDKGIGVAQEE